MKYLIKFSKRDLTRFIGHLDLLKNMQRAVKMSGIPIAYSSGYNPHQLISFAAPLTIGMTGFSEYMEITTLEHCEKLEIIQKINERLPHGLEILDIREMDKTEKSTASLLRAAMYEVDVSGTPDELSRAVRQVNESTELSVMKINGKGVKSIVDIRQGIYSLQLLPDGKVNMLLAQGNTNHVKPEFVVQSMCSFMKHVAEPAKTSYQRMELYKENSNEHNGFISIFAC